jgi:hypothetical protein
MKSKSVFNIKVKQFCSKSDETGEERHGISQTWVVVIAMKWGFRAPK